MGQVKNEKNSKVSGNTKAKGKANKCILHDCLYFTANSLSRSISRMAEQEFSRTGLSPALAFLLMAVVENPQIGQKELSARLHLAPSTVTRFVDTLVNRGYISRTHEGKTTTHTATKEGLARFEEALAAWGALHKRYSKVLGSRDGAKITKTVDEASEKLEADL